MQVTLFQEIAYCLVPSVSRKGKQLSYHQLQQGSCQVKDMLLGIFSLIAICLPSTK